MLSILERRAFAKGVELGLKKERKLCLLLVFCFVIIFEFVNVLFVVSWMRFCK